MRIRQAHLLQRFWERHEDAKGPLQSWNEQAKRATWKQFADVKGTFPSCRNVAKGMVIVFKVCGNEYRLTVECDYRSEVVIVTHVETHREYNRRLGYK